LERISGEAGNLLFTSSGVTRRVTPLTRVFSVSGFAGVSVVVFMMHSLFLRG
jgi:hypothetical protein